MDTQNPHYLNRLQRLLPEGLLVDADWMSRQGYSTSLRSKYVRAGWLYQPIKRVFRRTDVRLNWQQAVLSLQMTLNKNLVVGGRTALELQGYAHYVPRRMKAVHVYGPEKPPSWLRNLPAGVPFIWHNSARVFTRFPKQLNADALPPEFTALEWGQWDWKLILSSPERAVLELLDEVPDRESFHQADKLFESLTNISPKKMENLLLDCHNIKVKRLFFFFADRHEHAWLRRINRSKIDLGKGKRMLVRGGTLNKAYAITVPKDLDDVA